MSNKDFIFKDKNNNKGTSGVLSDDDHLKLNKLVKAVNVILNTSDATNFIDTLATKAYVDSETNKAKKEIGETVFSLTPLQNAGYHLFDGTQLSGSGIYADFVAYYEELKTNHPDWNCWISEADWQTCVTTYGACGKFVVDTTNHTVRLPKVTGIVEGTIDANALGDLVEAGLPNATGTFNGVRYGPYNVSTSNGCVTSTPQNAWWATQNDTSSTQHVRISTIDLSLNKANSIYKNNFNKVQPQTIKGYFYIVLANVTKTEIQVDIDNVATDLNGKADKDFTNIDNTAKIAIAHNAMPSNVYDNLTVGASGTQYTAPADGYFHFSIKATSTTGHIQLDNSGIFDSTLIANTYQGFASLMPAKKGDRVTLTYPSGAYVYNFKFIYAVGSESEQV